MSNVAAGIQAVVEMSLLEFPAFTAFSYGLWMASVGSDRPSVRSRGMAIATRGKSSGSAANVLADSARATTR